MIQAFELHEGSIIKANNRNGGAIMAIKRILEHTEEGQRMVDLFHEGEGMNYELLKDCEGVPFTPDLLRRLGFKKVWFDKDNKVEGHYYHMPLSENKYCDLAFMSSRNKKGVMEVCLFPYDAEFRVQYVHELQNWHAALKRKPLTLKP